ncbi:MAG: SDR family oxidoreductase [Candidatus Eisenbacteria bacterium]|uniref:SDR family oxidoreductase n=1 Tax=Eiseniibacteriota bacterium TaxID=2212470 RepID=A0A7Y2E763_UNCEI|nr:SDR family oxidoreductase [Candidatus Eisenbacteria bacterium]
MDKRILVTGGAGYIGSHVTRLLLEKGYRVRVLDKLAWGGESLEEFADNPNFELYQGDIRHVEDLVGSLEDVYGVIHLAGIVGDPACALDPDTTFSINIEATQVIVDVAKYRKVERFVFASTCSVYGAAEDYWLNEGSVLNPVSLYAETNLQSEEIIFRGFKDSTTIPTIVRFGTIYGASKRMRFDLVVNIMSAKGATENKVKVFGGDQWRPNVHCRDAARATIACLEAPVKNVAWEIFNVGSNDQNYRILELGELVAATIPGTEVEVLGDSPDKRSYRVSFDKINHVLGFTCEHKVEGGVQEISDMLKNGTIQDYQDDRYYNVRYLYR